MKKPTDNVKKYVIVMLIGVILNQGLYTLSSFLDLPTWLDVTGTALVAIALEPAAGVIVGFINNFCLSLIFNDMSTIIYFLVSGAVAVICGVCMRNKKGEVDIKRVIPTMLIVFVVSVIISGTISLFRVDAISNSYWELHFYNQFIDMGIPRYLSCYFDVAIVKGIDTVITTILVMLAFVLLPKSLKNKVLIEK